MLPIDELVVLNNENDRPNDEPNLNLIIGIEKSFLF